MGGRLSQQETFQSQRPPSRGEEGKRTHRGEGTGGGLGTWDMSLSSTAGSLDRGAPKLTASSLDLKLLDVGHSFSRYTKQEDCQ